MNAENRKDGKGLEDGRDVSGNGGEMMCGPEGTARYIRPSIAVHHLDTTMAPLFSPYCQLDCRENWVKSEQQVTAAANSD